MIETSLQGLKGGYFNRGGYIFLNGAWHGTAYRAISVHRANFFFGPTFDLEKFAELTNPPLNPVSWCATIGVECV